jgi:hypothetical protein
MDELFSEIARRLIEFAKSKPYSGSNHEWKVGIFRILGDKGRELGFQAFHGPCKGVFPNCHEHIYDLTWLSKTGEIALAVELEFQSEAQILYDFAKLVDANARLKVLIYTVPRTKDSGQRIRSQIEGRIAQSTSQVAGQQYLFVEFGSNDHRAYSYVVPTRGAVGPVSLLAM